MTFGMTVELTENGRDVLYAWGNDFSTCKHFKNTCRHVYNLQSTNALSVEYSSHWAGDMHALCTNAVKDIVSKYV